MKKYLPTLKEYRLATLEAAFAVIFALAGVLTGDTKYALFAIALSLLSSVNVQSIRIKAIEDKLK
ncbi:TMhelix containing protein [Vibrio phage 1.199.A._10N.286.55.C10]|nr:TMhelix containing protein [Vibrio phage 1.199.A._10N.286.55.C10]AUR95017.1 TMhelix containing protein [Vibrio phage 1.199.B._10N.286.55.C10]